MSLIFQCKFCPAISYQFKDLVRHYETRHNQEGEQYRSSQDIKNYRGIDSGCKRATDHLGSQSSCLKCPFPKCVLDELGVGIVTAKKRNRNEEIKERFKKGESISDLARAFDVSERTIRRIVRRCG